MIEVVIVGGLITWRLSNILAKQKGPLDLIEKLRAYLATNQKQSGGLFDFVTCMTCISMPIAFLTAILPSQSVFQFIAYTLCFSAVSGLLDALTSKS